MKIKKLGALLVSAALCAGMAAPAFAFEGDTTPVEQPVLPEVVEDVVTVTDETSGALTAEVNEMVRTAKVTPEQLAALLRQSAATTPNPAALSAVGATFEKEDDADED